MTQSKQNNLEIFSALQLFMQKKREERITLFTLCIRLFTVHQLLHLFYIVTRSKTNALRKSLTDKNCATV